jgi:leucyl aminopeptidase
MRIRVTKKDLSKLVADLAVCFAYEDDREPSGVEESGLRRALAAEMKAERFKGQPTDLVVWNTDGRYGSRRFVVIGLGEPGGPPGEAIRQGAARASRAASRFSARSLAMRLPEGAPDGAAAEVRAAIEGAVLGGYHFELHLTDKTRRIFRPQSLEVSVNGETRGLNRASKLGQLGARAVGLARDLVNEGPSRMNPSALAKTAAKEARAAGLGCKTLSGPELRKLGMSALLNVARGSKESGRVVHLSYKPVRGRARERIVLVGKGVTFDSGGLNLKNADGMLTMKSDMAGAAAVLATMTTLGSIGCRAEVHALLGLVENMTGPDAYKPGDILDTYSGKTVEVMNTDAEGRLVLCDLLAYAADKLEPTRIVDLATLTGACVVALGLQASGIFSRDDDLANGILEGGRAAGEKLWRLPLYEEYLHLLQRGPADLRSTGGRWGGAITAALFLGEFVPRELPWLHMDIAGPAYAETELPAARVGGTGAGVLTLMRWLETF